MIALSGGSTTHLGIPPSKLCRRPGCGHEVSLAKISGPLTLPPIEQAFVQFVPLQKMAEVEDIGLVVRRVRMPLSH